MKKLKLKKIKIPLLGAIIHSFKSITWPTAKELAKSLFAVLVISVIISAYLWLLDTGFGELRNLILFN